MVERVFVFLDYQNIYRRARDAFHLTHEPHWEGQVHPYGVAYELCRRSEEWRTRQLAGVRVYRGLPNARMDPQGNAACLRQLAFWESLPKVEAVKRPLQYPPPGSRREVREKGIDVQLAIDVVMGAINNRYDCAVVFSADTDIIPALEAVVEIKGRKSVEVATWEGCSRIGSKKEKIWCHYLDRKTYEQVADRHDYNTPRPGSG